MSLVFTAEQRELQSTFRRLLKSHLSSAYLRKRIEGSVDGKDLRAKIDELGLEVAFLSEEREGLGLGFKELSILAFEGGRALLPEWSIMQLLGGVLFASRIVKGDRASSSPLLESLSKGERVLSFALFTPSDGEHRFITGNSGLVLRFIGEQAEIIEIKPGELIKENSLDLTLSYYRNRSTSAAIFKLSAEESELIRSALNVVAAAEMAGICERAVEMTVEQVTTRKQFDVPVGGFQAVQHKLADMHVATESLRALANFAAWSCDYSLEQVSLATRAAIMQACEQGPEIIESAIQLHGGIGFTWEHDLHLYLRRARTISALYGGAVSAQQMLSAVR